MGKKEWKGWEAKLSECKSAYRFPNGDVGVYNIVSKKCLVMLRAAEARKLFVKLSGDYRD